ncbi:MAG: prolipoprotein diacylglyceryl transferase [Fimbriimonadaceae bacterium]|nr:prolipoprotein diacylglyceryl transferase [Fimbriimonadaceae bacterium]
MSAGEGCTAAGYVVAGLLLWREARQRRMATRGVGWVALAGLWGGLLGARLAHWLVVQPGLLATDPSLLLDPRAGGRTVLGGIVGGWLAVELTKRYLGLRRSTGNLFAPALAAGEAVGRVGCLLQGCCFGRPCDLPWAIWQHGAWRHPTQVYSLLLCLALLPLLYRPWPREGDRFRVYLLTYGAGRAVIEAFRDQGGGAGWPTAGQWACLALMAAAAIWWRRERIQAAGRSEAVGGPIP